MKAGDKVAIFGTLISIENINATVVVDGPNGIKLTLKMFPECLELIKSAPVKKYRYRLHGVWNTSAFLNWDRVNKVWVMNNTNEINGFQTQFTDEEVKSCPVPLESFEKIEVVAND